MIYLSPSLVINILPMFHFSLVSESRFRHHAILPVNNSICFSNCGYLVINWKAFFFQVYPFHNLMLLFCETNRNYLKILIVVLFFILFICLCFLSCFLLFFLLILPLILEVFLKFLVFCSP